ncbi:MAG: YbjN domain-containing protein [Thermonemataceae bacterium]|nr:YbjN domain-containing protein [Thermonemataceae bacterium]
MSHLDYIRTVEEAFRLLGVDPKDAQSPIQGAWILQRGSAKIRVMLNSTPTTDGEELTLSMMVYIMPIPRKKQKEFFRKLLEMNSSFVNERFEIFDSEIYMTASRYLDGLDAQEVVDIMLEISETADYFDDRLLKEFPLD